VVYRGPSAHITVEEHEMTPHGPPVRMKRSLLERVRRMLADHTFDEVPE
jgi:hypothetical protein